MTAPEVFALYRHLIRTAKSKFQGDHPALNAAYTEIKSQFMLHSNAADTQVPQLVEAGREAAAFLNEAVVQAKLNDRGAYEVANLPDDKVVNLTTPDEVKDHKHGLQDYKQDLVLALTIRGSRGVLMFLTSLHSGILICLCEAPATRAISIELIDTMTFTVDASAWFALGAMALWSALRSSRDTTTSHAVASRLQLGANP